MCSSDDPRDIVKCPQCSRPHSWNWCHDTWCGTKETRFKQGELEVTVCSCECGGTVGVTVLDGFGGDAYVLWHGSSED